ncbi:CHAT domain-containing protein [Archangium primigenium]|uniref:CHAT domain-containing protein n=1 Tax=[Archangium] primigenium TaxID=2792470 RepID=UPI001956757D|nr:tetratricopeptide repeat protein [Archangium primigenium]MBM7115771.1 tetratricopeptide repeat protein [Archangium primigenium]
MGQMLGWMLVVVLASSADGGSVPVEPDAGVVVVLADADAGTVLVEPGTDAGIVPASTDARLQMAQKDYDTVLKARDAGKYDEAQELAKKGLDLWAPVLGNANPKVADFLDLIGELCRLRGDLDHAETWMLQAQGIRETSLGKSHPDLATSLNNLAVLYSAQGFYGRAEPYFQRALSLREVSLGESHPDVATTLHHLGMLYSTQGLYSRAELLLQRALKSRKALGMNSPAFAESLQALADLYLAQGLYSQAEPLYLQALQQREASLGKNHPRYAESLHALGRLRAAQGRYTDADALYVEALKLREELLGKGHPDFADSHEGLARLLGAQGKYADAEPLYQKALPILEATLGKSHPRVATVLHHLAILHGARGLYSQAEPLFQRALKLREGSLGETHPDVATTMHHLAQLYSVQGLYERAEPPSLRAFELRETLLGKSHPDVAESLSQLANLYSAQGMYEKAEPLYMRALAIRETSLSECHPDVATSLHELAHLYNAQGMQVMAEPLYTLALECRLKTLGDKHLHVATSLHELANLYSAQGVFDEAEPYYLRALEIREQALGKNHPDVADSLDQLAQLRLAQGRLGDALPFYTRAFGISEQRLRQESLDFSESRLSAFLRDLRVSEERLYELLRAYSDDAQVRHLALSAVLLRKGRAVEESAHISRILSQSLSAEDRDLLEKLRSLRTQLASRSLAGPGALDAKIYQDQLKALSDEGDKIEQELAKRSATLRARTALPAAADIVTRVTEAIPRGSALVEYIVYEDSSAETTPSPARGKGDKPLGYLALLLFPDGSTRMVDLGPARPIDDAATRLLYSLANQGEDSKAHAQTLYRLAFAPLVPELGDTRRLFVSPDGQLGLVPFAVLHNGQEFLVDSFDFIYLTSGRTLLPREEKQPSPFIFVLADPDFTAAPSSAPSNASQLFAADSVLGRFFRSARAILPRQLYARLTGSLLEAQAIQKLFPQAQLFVGTAATKEKLMHLPTPGILHLATHGFFLGDVPESALTRGVVGTESMEGGLPPPQLTPLLNSGLVLASARALEPKASAPRPDATMVTAMEMAGLDLWGTHLVVLSACDTGRGEVRKGQGIYGMRSALMVAGAETVVMSLWKVSDETTRLLMEEYYRGLLAGGGRVAALREAMRSLRGHEAYKHPYHWAPFIGLGRDAPLQAIVAAAQKTPATPVDEPPPEADEAPPEGEDPADTPAEDAGDKPADPQPEEAVTPEEATAAPAPP